jgi:hypothetical protein
MGAFRVDQGVLEPFSICHWWIHFGSATGY